MCVCEGATGDGCVAVCCAPAAHLEGLGALLVALAQREHGVVEGGGEERDVRLRNARALRLGKAVQVAQRVRQQPRNGRLQLVQALLCVCVCVRRKFGVRRRTCTTERVVREGISAMHACVYLCVREHVCVCVCACVQRDTWICSNAVWEVDGAAARQRTASRAVRVTVGPHLTGDVAQDGRRLVVDVRQDAEQVHVDEPGGAGRSERRTVGEARHTHREREKERKRKRERRRRLRRT